VRRLRAGKQQTGTEPSFLETMTSDEGEALAAADEAAVEPSADET